MKFQGIEVKRAMAVYAHPDDAEFGWAGTIAKLARGGVDVTYCMVTNGASGSDDPKMTRRKLRETRYAEQRAAAKLLGVKHCVFLGYEDGYLYPTLEVRRDIARQIRIHKPDVLFAQDPSTRYAGDYVNHPDHIAAGEATLRSINPDASTRQMFPELWKKERLEPHKPKLLLIGSFGGDGTVVDISDTIELKVKALLAHTSQLWPGAEELVRDWAKRAGKTKGYRAGEAFRVLRVGVNEVEEEKDAERSRGRRGAQRNRATSTRAPRKRTPSRSRRAR